MAKKIELTTFFENKYSKINAKKFIAFLFLFGFAVLTLTKNHPIGDFGNYYYGSKFFRDGINPLSFYKSIHNFNVLISKYESGAFFENYAPVPPFSLLFYLPLTCVNLHLAKLIFNLFGLVFFCFSFYKLIRTLGIFNYAFYLLPLVFLQSFYSNFHHGQTYLIISALLFEAYIATIEAKKIKIGLLIAILFSLKIFPAFIAVLFVLKKDWQTIKWMLLFVAIIQTITLCFVGVELMSYYYFTVFPKLALNEITAPFSYTNQSISTLLLTSFVYHPYLNLTPIVNSPTIAVLIQLILCSFCFSVLIQAIFKKQFIVQLFISLLVLILLNKYTTVYSLIILFPFVFLSQVILPKKTLLIYLLLLLACNIPVYKLEYLPLVVQYSRVWIFLLLFFVLFFELGLTLKYKRFLICLVIFALPSFSFYNYNSSAISEFRSMKGSIHNYKVFPNHILLYTCMGSRDTVEIINFKAAGIDSITNKKTKKVLLNKNQVLELSDDNSGVGIYYLKLSKIN